MPGFFDLTPDPKVLIALTHTPMQPMDALCELIDNAIDSFHYARLQGQPIDHPLIVIDLPRRGELKQNSGRLLIRDNGPGLGEREAELAIKAGYSGNNPYDSLGLFGMGFNISTGKLGRVTRLFTARSGYQDGVEVIIDLEQLRESRSYQVPFVKKAKPPEFNRGTEIEIREWWPEGNPNSGFIRKLIQYGLPTICSEVGRRYATILGKREVRITINGEPCVPFEHCAWADHRYVERQKHGKIPAVFRFNEVVHTQRRCTSCNTLVPPDLQTCPICHGASARTVEERLEGWVGIQRFDDATDYGIDLIRNGRAIRVGEKAAFFEFTNELGRTIKDYPIDGPYGRIIGEVHLNHVPVDFLKQDFQRSSPEWIRAMAFLRGESSLQPGQPGADQNQSPIFKLYQGYRRVRTPGKTDLYMGYWDNGPKRLHRDDEAEFRRKFAEQLPGYYDDEEWYKQVEKADQRPLEALVECPDCGAQNLKGRDRCDICNGIIQPKTCINPACALTIARGDTICEYCGASQVPDVKEPWKCLVCSNRNAAEDDTCAICGVPRGAQSPTSREWLLQHSNKSEDLSIHNCSVVLANGSDSEPFNVVTYVTQEEIRPYGGPGKLPLITFKGSQVEIFIDTSHDLMETYSVQAEQLVAAEVAMYLFELYRSLTGPQYQGKHSLANLEWAIISKYFSDSLTDSDQRLRDDLRQFFSSLQERLANHAADVSNEIFGELADDAKRQFAENLLNNGHDISKVSELTQNGSFLRHVAPETIVEVLRSWPQLFFDNRVWHEPFQQMAGLPDQVVLPLRKRVVASYLNCLEDVAAFLSSRSAQAVDPAALRRCRASLEFLQKKLV